MFKKKLEHEDWYSNGAPPINLRTEMRLKKKKAVSWYSHGPLRKAKTADSETNP
jgi:hypothetical protein